MSSVIISGDTSGAITVSAPAVAGTNTLTLLAATATNSVNTLGTAVATTSGTSIDITGLPSWIKRITVMFNGVSTSSTSNPIIQIGSGSIVTTGYNGQASSGSTGLGVVTTGFPTWTNVSSTTVMGNFVLVSFGSNIWSGTGIFPQVNGTAAVNLSGGISPTLSGSLDRIRITTLNGTDTFDAGSVNILYEG